jgi:DNA invertase Pin-like site-specific DNA recombinase
MANKLDADRIEKARSKKVTKSKRQIEKERFQDDFEYNKSGKSQLTVIEPKKEVVSDTAARKLKVGAYVRVSTQEEAQVGSYEMQMKHFTDEIKENPQYEMVKIYCDEGISGTQVCKRKGFLEMIEDAKGGKLDLILTKSITRFGRNAADILSTLQMMETLNPAVSVIFESDHIDTSDGKNKILISIMSALSELESQLKSEAIKGGIMYRMQNGNYRFSVHNTLGYYRDYRGRVCIEENEAQIVRYIYDEFLEGGSPDEIATALTKDGISSPKGHNCWRAETIKSILSNEKYCGDVLYQKTYTQSYITHLSKKNNGVQRQWHWTNRHDAIIQKDRWLVAQELLIQKKWSKKKHPIKNIAKKFFVARVKTGKLAGFYLIDQNWNNEEREQFLALIKSVILYQNQQNEKE